MANEGAVVGIQVNITFVHAALFDYGRELRQGAVITLNDGADPGGSLELLLQQIRQLTAESDITVRLPHWQPAPAAALQPATAARLLYLSDDQHPTQPSLEGPLRRQRAQGKRHTEAVLALARRRVNVLWAMLRDHRPYQEQPPSHVLAA